MMSAALSPIAIAGAFVLADINCGTTDRSITLNRWTPRTLISGGYSRHLVISTSHAARANGMVICLHGSTRMLFQRGLRFNRWARKNLAHHVLLHLARCDNPPRSAQALDYVTQVHRRYRDNWN
jgi:hypothetical protein